MSYAALAVGDVAARRNILGNAVSLVRALRGAKGGGIVVTSGAGKTGAVRAPMDVVNLSGLWGYGGEKGRAGVGGEARAVVVAAEMRRRSWRGVVDVVGLGEVPRVVGGEKGGKRKAEEGREEEGEKGGAEGKEDQAGGQGQGQEQGGNKKKRRKGKGGAGGGQSAVDSPNI